MAVSFSVNAMVRGYHVYQDIWDASVSEELPCQREPGNSHDPFAVAIVRAGVTVGHVPRKLSSTCSLFIRRGGSIRCRVTGSRHFSEDLPQGGLEIPCLLIFQGSMKDAMKAEKVVRSALSASDIAKPATRGESESQKPKRRKLTALELCPNVDGLDGILKGARLSDQHIHQAQCLIKQQFPQLSGLRSTLYQSKCEQEAGLNNQLQVIHSRGDHWIVSSTVDCEDGKVKVYDCV